MTGTGPPAEALAAFGLRDTPVPLPGGQGTSWRAGAAVLKPAVADRAFVQWQGELLTRLRGRTDFRVSVPLRTREGGWTSGGWTASTYEPGAHLPRRWHDVVAVGRQLHVALDREPEPHFLRARTDVWAIADRVAWGELPVACAAGAPHLAELTQAMTPLHLRRQLVHGDLTGNVLFSDGLPPLVLDFSPYWRPPAFASAVVVADALLEGDGEENIEPLRDEPALAQCLLRALVFRVVAAQLARPDRLRVGVDDAQRSAVRRALWLALGS